MRSRKKQGRRHGRNMGFTPPRQIDTGLLDPKTKLSTVVSNDRGAKKRILRAATRIYTLIENAVVRAYHSSRTHGAGLSAPPRRYEQDEMAVILKPIAKMITVHGIADALTNGTLDKLLNSVASSIGLSTREKAAALSAAA